MLRTLRRIVVGLLLVAIGGGTLILLDVQWKEASHIYKTADKITPAPVVMVFGASVNSNDTPSDALEDRVMTAVDLYKTGKAQRILMTGDDGRFHVNEVSVMQKTAIAAGVPSSAIDIDGEGYRTYESCKRAAQVLFIKKAILVTQRFHLGRAMYLCDAFGMDVQGMVADRQSYRRILFFTVRDYAASLKAWWDVNIWAPASPVKS